MCALHFGDFYQRPLIPIGEQDRVTVLKSGKEIHTHWLIAIEGSETNKNSASFHWKVVVFPSDCNGSFDFSVPLYVSSFFPFNEAVAYAKQLEKMAKEDEFYKLAN
ncbi:hypothetical protein ACFSCX_10525 [Bacillus salitolerans]|uniref:Uncharacterized protein n=1 Tax=Bacillus salitolerans TaxID=1437434 RepID=A0ABW4LPR5_9BACI